MKANELRIGNWIYSKTYSKEIQMKSFFGLCNVEASPDLFKPIPLTEEWLLKLGCIEVYENAFQDVDLTFIVEFKENKFIVYLICPMPWIELEHIKYVHQLQNLYFALTGEELIIKSE
jgi:hypothetical protein